MQHAVPMLALILSTVVTAPLSAQTSDPAASQEAAADLCQELIAYADKAAADQATQKNEPAASGSSAPPPRRNGEGTGTQGGGSVSSSSSTNTQTQSSQAPTTPAAPTAAPEAASSPHATGGGDKTTDMAARLTAIRHVAERRDRQACRDAVQVLRRDGAELPAALIALAAYEPNAAKR